MDSQAIVGILAWGGGILGGVVGVLGGLYGTHRSIKATNGLRERAFVIRASVACGLGVSAFLACLILLPMPWRPLLWLVYMPSLFYFIRKWNERQVLARAEDQADPPA